MGTVLYRGFARQTISNEPVFLWKALNTYVCYIKPSSYSPIFEINERETTEHSGVLQVVMVLKKAHLGKI